MLSLFVIDDTEGKNEREGHCHNFHSISKFFACGDDAYQIRPGLSVSWKTVLKLIIECPCSECFCISKKFPRTGNPDSANTEVKAAVLYLQARVLSCSVTRSVS